jgi:iron complex outermembrane receptor protein
MKKPLAFLCGCLTVATAFADPDSNQLENPTLEPFVVTATRYPEESAKVAAFITVLTQQEIKKSGARTVNEAIMRLGGIVGRPSLYGGNEYSLDISGFGDTASSNMVYIIDGVTFKQGDASEVRLGNISLDEVERIEIQRGGSSVLYGEGAVAGVINIVTHASGLRGKAENTGKIEAGFGSYGSRDAKASASFGKDGLNLHASSGKTESDGFRSNSASHADNGSLSLQLTGDNTRLGGSYTKSNEYAQTPGSLTVTQYQSNRNQADADNLSVGTYSNASSNHYGFFIETELKDILWRADLKRREKNYYFLDQYSGSASYATHNTTNDSYIFTANKKWNFDSGMNRLIAGIEKNNWNQTRVTSSFGDYTNLSYTKALFLKNDTDIDRWDTRVTTGYRIEDMVKNSTGTTDSYSPYSSKKTLSAWELSASKAIDSINTVWAKVSRNYRLPNIDEFSTSYDTTGTYILTLSPQTSTDTDIGWKYKSTYTSLEGRLFQSEITNEISYDTFYQTNMNLDPTRRQGIEGSIRQSITSNLEIQGFAAYRKSIFVSGDYAGNKLPMAPQNVYNLRASWTFSPAQTFSLGVSYVGDQQIAGDFSNATTMPAYSVTDFFYRYQTKQWECQFAVRNVFNKEYYSYATDAYSTWQDSSTRYTALYPDMKRNLFLNFKYYLR